MSDRNRYREDDDWARQVPWERSRGPYRDYGWERGQSEMPEFRDDSVSIMPYERDRVGRWRDMGWDEEYNRGRIEEQGPYVGVGPKGYRRSDERIFEDVCERLTRHGRIDARNIEIHVKDGEVTLKGKVTDRMTKRMAEDVADKVRGVKDVHNELRIEETGVPGGGRGRVDQVGRSGVYPASGPHAPGNAEAQGMASWGQGERGAEGYGDSGRSEAHPIKEGRGQNKQ